MNNELSSLKKSHQNSGGSNSSNQPSQQNLQGRSKGNSQITTHQGTQPTNENHNTGSSGNGSNNNGRQRGSE